MTGAMLVGLVMDRWSHVPDLEYRTLVRMAHMALDTARDGRPAATYWGGRAWIARCWRPEWPQGYTPEEEHVRDARLREVTAVMGRLRDRRAIARSRYRPPGIDPRRAVYELTLYQADPRAPRT